VSAIDHFKENISSAAKVVLLSFFTQTIWLFKKFRGEYFFSKKIKQFNCLILSVLKTKRTASQKINQHSGRVFLT
jgi:hypothetical protein